MPDIEPDSTALQRRDAWMAWLDARFGDSNKATRLYEPAVLDDLVAAIARVVELVNDVDERMDHRRRMEWWARWFHERAPASLDLSALADRAMLALLLVAAVPDAPQRDVTDPAGWVMVPT